MDEGRQPKAEELERMLETTVHEYAPEPEKKKHRLGLGQTITLVGVFVAVALMAAWLGGAFRRPDDPTNGPDIEQQRQEAAKAAARQALKEKGIKDAVLGGQAAAAPETEADRIWRQAESDAKEGQGNDDRISGFMKQLEEQDRAGETGYPPSAGGQPTAAEQYWRDRSDRASRQQDDPRSVYHVRGDNPAEEKQRLDKAREEYEKEKTPMFVYQRSGVAGPSWGNSGPATAGATRKTETARDDAPPEAGAPLPEDDPSSYLQPGQDLANKGRGGRTTAASPFGQARREEERRQTTLFYTRYEPVTMFEGDFLECVLLHRIVSDTEESPVLAVVVRDLVDNSGKWVIVPQGTRIVGKTKIVDYTGAHRMYILFHRMILPDGVSVEFPYNVNALKALDRTGALGVSSQVNRHWMLQFGTALLFGVLDGLGGAATAATESRNGAYIVDRTSQNIDKVMDSILRRYQNVVPTITVDQGTRLRIFITDDVAVTPYMKVKDRSYAAVSRKK